VRQTLTQLGIPGYRVLRWENDAGAFRNPHDFPALSLACTGTHDTEPLAEWWPERPDWERQNVARAYPEFQGVELVREFTAPIHRALVSAALHAGSDLCILPWQDVFGLRDRVNLPGSMSDANWTYRMAQPVERLLEDDFARARADQLAEMTRLSGRSA
jgi:4-alpha-glucanotransferase